MPSSHPEWISHICERLIELQPRTALDIGCGYGKWGVLYNAYCNAYVNRTDGVIDAIEVYKPYIDWINKNLPGVYGRIDNVDLENDYRIYHFGNYQCAFCFDMIEHVSKETGHLLLEAMLYCQIAFITTPVNWFPSSNHFGNEHERHKCLWTAGELSQYGTVKTGKVLHLLEIGA